MKHVKKILLLALALMVHHNAYTAVTTYNPYTQAPLVTSPITEEDFVMVENTPEMIEVNNDKTTSQKVTATIENTKKMLSKAENSLNQIKNAVESDEVSRFVGILKSMKNSLKKMIFKDGPGFQITNKTTEPIWVSLVVDNDIISNQDEYGRDQIAPGEKLTMELQDLSHDMKIGIYTQDPDLVVLANGNLDPLPDYTYETTTGARGKTKYFTWNPEKHKMKTKYLYPQTGRLAGTVKVSRSNYNLSNNIKAYQLKLKEQK